MSGNTSSSISSSGIGFFGALAILFIALKLTHYIDWSWWWVLAPIWGPTLLVLGGFGAWIGYMVRKELKAERKKKLRAAGDKSPILFKRNDAA